MIKIAVDAMGGDYSPEKIVLGSLMAIKKYKDIEIILYGDETKIKKYLNKDYKRLSIIHTDEYLDMGELDPLKAVRDKKNSSMFLAMQDLKNKKVDALVTAGPTQALVIGGHLIIKRMKGVKRTALITFIPSATGRTRLLLDSGANVDLKPEHLRTYATFGTLLASEYLNIKNPKVGLLNIGSEEGKGREFEKLSYDLLKEEKNINFIGNVEPKEFFDKDCDIVLNDGFVGNIFLKSLEGCGKHMSVNLKKEIFSNFKSKMGALFMRKTIKKFAKTLDSSEIGGALLFGIDGLLIKAHGSSNELAIFNALTQAKKIAQSELIDKIRTVVSEN